MCVKDWCRHQYYEALDLVVNCVKARFNQPGYQLYRHLESLLLNAADCESFEEDLHKVTDSITMTQGGRYSIDNTKL